mmetsp:Transcript_10856/g.22579  ORF Transcript_10856/g.22579 Transcript_10856/m.22579 type:complete len:343 (+) Transcript_10856:1962-2990(+)
MPSPRHEEGEEPRLRDAVEPVPLENVLQARLRQKAGLFRPLLHHPHKVAAKCVQGPLKQGVSIRQEVLGQAEDSHARVDGQPFRHLVHAQVLQAPWPPASVAAAIAAATAAASDVPCTAGGLPFPIAGALGSQAAPSERQGEVQAERRPRVPLDALVAHILVPRAEAQAPDVRVRLCVLPLRQQILPQLLPVSHRDRPAIERKPVRDEHRVRRPNARHRVDDFGVPLYDEARVAVASYDDGVALVPFRFVGLYPLPLQPRPRRLDALVPQARPRVEDERHVVASLRLEGEPPFPRLAQGLARLVLLRQPRALERRHHQHIPANRYHHVAFIPAPAAPSSARS